MNILVLTDAGNLDNFGDIDNDPRYLKPQQAI
jgi:hypothetical protein